jgi:MFS family permease
MTVYVTDYLRALRLVSRDVRMYLLTAALIGLSYFGFVTVLLNLYLLRLGYGTAFIGLVNGGSALAFAVSSVPAGAAGGRWGYRRTVVLGIFLLSAGTLLLPLSEYLPDAGRDAGVEERTYVFSMQVALLPLGGFIGSLIAGMMPNFFAAILDVLPEHPAPYRYPLILAGVLLFPAVLALFTTREVTISSRPSETRPKTAAAPYIIITFLALTALLRMGGEGAARTFFNVYLDADLGVSTSRIGLLTAVGQLLAGPAALVAPLLVLRIGKMPAIVLSTMAMAGSLLLMGLVPHWAGVGFGFMGVISMRAITRSIVNVVQMEIVSPGWRGTTSGVVAMAMGIGFTSMALGGGYLIPAMGYRGLFLTAAGMGAASTLLFWSYFRVPRGEYARSDYAQQQAASVSP